MGGIKGGHSSSPFTGEDKGEGVLSSPFHPLFYSPPSRGRNWVRAFFLSLHGSFLIISLPSWEGLREGILSLIP